jgi:phosphopantothenoylcysteine decarboxylase/phosphopantothenate--cysteine ligase
METIRNKKILITCGPTWVPVDDVRVISNRSTGEMGHLIAEEFVARQAKVTLLEGPVTHVWSCKSVKIVKYNFFDELQKALSEQLNSDYDVVVHAAAVSDFKVAKTYKTKISSAKRFSLDLVPTLKLINGIKAKSKNTFLVGFKLDSKLEVGSIVKETGPLFKKADCDLVVANSLRGGYKGFIIDKDQQIWLKTDSKKALAKGLVRLISQVKSL